MAQQRIRAAFMRGGTSKAVVFHERDLPPEGAERDAVLLAVMGSPDPNGRQLDGMGGGFSSVSKVCIVAPSDRPDADVAYTFAQVLVGDAAVDYSGNCGNMAAAIGPFAADEGLVAAPRDGDATVLIHNTNTDKIIRSRFSMADGVAATAGDIRIDGVSRSGAPVRLEFLDPGGAKTGRLLPTGRVLDRLRVEDIGVIDASMVDAANPCVFVRASDLGCTGIEPVEALDRDDRLLARLEAIRRAAALAMGLAADEPAAARLPSVPKVAMVATPQAAATLSGAMLLASEHDIMLRMISMGRPHRAVPMTGAICLAVAMRLVGSVPNLVGTVPAGDVRIAHPSGVVVVDAALDGQDGGLPSVRYGAILRTARRLFDGHVLFDPIGER